MENWFLPPECLVDLSYLIDLLPGYFVISIDTLSRTQERIKSVKGWGLFA